MNSQIVNLLDRPIAYHRCFVQFGGVKAAIFLSQALYWQKRMKRRFYKQMSEWQEETGLSRKEQESARKSLAKFGILDVKREGIPPKMWYEVRTAKLAQLLEISNMSQTDITESPNGTLRDVRNGHSTTETTTENTTEEYNPRSSSTRSQISETDSEEASKEESNGHSSLNSEVDSGRMQLWRDVSSEKCRCGHARGVHLMVGKACNFYSCDCPGFSLPKSSSKPLYYSPAFLEFWSLYPRKVGGKLSACRAWGKATKQASSEEILEGLKAQLPRMKTKEFRFIPYPATWLNQGRWEDIPEPSEYEKPMTEKEKRRQEYRPRYD